MKKILIMFLLFSVIFASCTFDEFEWADFEDRCSEKDCSDFVIYFNASKYRESSGFITLDVVSEEDQVKYIPDFSFATSAGAETQILPGFNYPLVSLIHAGVNYSYFIPSTWSDDRPIFFRLVVNDSEGYPKCSQANWELVNDLFLDDSLLNLNAEVNFNQSTHKFEFDLKNNEVEDLEVFISVFLDNELKESTRVDLHASGSGSDEIIKESRFEYESLNVSRGIYTTYVVAKTETKSFLLFDETFLFYDFELEVPEIPKFRPGESYSLDLLLKNTGSLLDEFDVFVDVLGVGLGELAGWSLSVTDPGTIDKGGEKVIKLSYTVPELQIGSQTLQFNVSSEELGIKTFDLVLRPQTQSNLEVNLRDISEVNAYEENNFSVVVYSSGTVSPLMFYYVYTEPALYIRRGVSSLIAEVGEINRDVVEFDVGGSCAMTEDNTRAFNAGRKVWMLGKVVYELTANLNTLEIETLLTLKDIVDAEKLKMTSEEANSLFSDTERLLGIIEDFVEGIQEEEDSEYFRNEREDLYLFLISFENELEDVGTDMSETCSSVDEVNLILFSIDLSTLDDREVTKTVFVEGPKVIELIGPYELKAISGESVSYEYILKNNAGEGFEIDFEPSDDIINMRSFIYLDAYSSKDIEIDLRPPEYFEVEELQVYINVKTRTHSIDFPLTVHIGKFEPELIFKEEYGVSPGSSQIVNLTLRTGGLDDAFSLSFTGPPWISLPNKIVTEKGEAKIKLEMSPSLSDIGSEEIEIELISNTFHIVISEDIEIYVSAEANVLINRLERNKKILEEKRELLSEREYYDVVDYLNEAEQAISENRYSTAKLRFNNAENILFKEIDEEGFNFALIIIPLILGAFGFAFWKFLLPKIKGTPEDEIMREVI